MTVQELIEALRELPQGADVKLWSHDNGDYLAVKNVECVLLVDRGYNCEWYKEFDPARHDRDAAVEVVRIH